MLKVAAASIGLLVGVILAIPIGFLVAVSLIKVVPSQTTPIITIGVSLVAVIAVYWWGLAKICLGTATKYQLGIPTSALLIPVLNILRIIAALGSRP